MRSLSLLPALVVALSLATGVASAAGKGSAHAHAEKASTSPQRTGPRYAEREDAMQFADALAAHRQLDPAWVRATLGQARKLAVVSRLMQPGPAGQPKNWAAYRSRFIDDTRIDAGVRFWQENRQTLLRAEQEFGVPAEIIVGIIGVETIYGRQMGDFRILDALATLSFDFPANHPRADERTQYFRGELEQFLSFHRAAGSDPLAPRGSYAGAWGMPQFMPSSLARWGVDYDGDGKVDLANSAGRCDRLGGQLLQGLRLDHRHAHALPGALRSREAGPRRPARARHRADLQRRAFPGQGRAARRRGPGAQGTARAGRAAERIGPTELRGRHGELLRDHPLQRIQLLRDGRDRTGTLGQGCPGRVGAHIVMPTLQSWQRLWNELGARVANGGLMNQLIAAYSEQQRHYHTLQHLRECLAHFEAAGSLARRPAEVELALWFHDAVYDPRRQDNEARSAEWASDSVLAAGCDAAVAQRVRALVLATRAHQDEAGDSDTQLLLDIDLAILGATPARFAESGRQIRAEYAHVDEAAFRAGRTRVLQGFLARPSLYLTAPYREALEARARANIGQALAALQA